MESYSTERVFVLWQHKYHVSYLRKSVKKGPIFWGVYRQRYKNRRKWIKFSKQEEKSMKKELPNKPKEEKKTKERNINEQTKKNEKLKKENI